MTMTGDPRPLRRWWPVAASVGAAILSSALAVFLAVGIQHRSAERDRQARVELQRAVQQLHDSICAVVIQFDNNYNSAPPETDAGKANAASIADLRHILGCPS
jgi:hypothetical protein